jgi:hypothetical protein
MDPVIAPSAESDTGTAKAGIPLGSESPNVEEPLSNGASSSLTTSRVRKYSSKRKPIELAMEMRTSSITDIGAEIMRRVGEITKVATTFSNLKSTYIKTLKEVASTIAADTMELTRRTGSASEGSNPERPCASVRRMYDATPPL